MNGQRQEKIYRAFEEASGLLQRIRATIDKGKLAMQGTSVSGQSVNVYQRDSTLLAYIAGQN